MVVIVEKNVRWLKIPVANAHAVHVVKSTEKLSCVELSKLKAESFLPLDVLEKFSIGHIFQNEIEAFLVIKAPDQVDYIGMRKVQKGLSFSEDRFYFSTLFQFLLGNCFNGIRESVALFLGEVNVAVRAATERADNFKVIKRNPLQSI